MWEDEIDLNSEEYGEWFEKQTRKSEYNRVRWYNEEDYEDEDEGVDRETLLRHLIHRR